jgi:hypothetical protein
MSLPGIKYGSDTESGRESMHTAAIETPALAEIKTPSRLRLGAKNPKLAGLLLEAL